MCEAEADALGSFFRCRRALTSVFGSADGITDDDCLIVRLVCERVVRRACMLLAAGLAAIMMRLESSEIIIAADGTLFRSHPMFYLRTKEKLIKLLGANVIFDINYSVEGSGLGAALVAASASASATLSATSNIEGPKYNKED